VGLRTTNIKHQKDTCKISHLQLSSDGTFNLIQHQTGHILPDRASLFGYVQREHAHLQSMEYRNDILLLSFSGQMIAADGFDGAAASPDFLDSPTEMRQV